MSNFIKVAEDVKAFGKKFSAIIELAEFLEGVGSLEQAAKNAAKSQLNAYALMEKAEQEVKAVESRLEYAQEKLKGLATQAGEIISDAEEKSKEIIKAAKQEGIVILLAVEKKKEGLDAQYLSACQELSSIRGDVHKEQKTLEVLRSQVSGIKSKLQAFVGAQ